MNYLTKVYTRWLSNSMSFLEKISVLLCGFMCILGSLQSGYAQEGAGRHVHRLQPSARQDCYALHV